MTTITFFCFSVFMIAAAAMYHEGQHALTLLLVFIGCIFPIDWLTYARQQRAQKRMRR